MRRLSFLLGGLAVGLLAYVVLDFWQVRNAPLHIKFERLWHDDVELLEASGKLPRQWQDVVELELIGGTPESKAWLKRIVVPHTPKAEGGHKLEILVVAWEQDGKRGVMVQYDLVNLKSRNTIFELARSYILTSPRP